MNRPLNLAILDTARQLQLDAKYVRQVYYSYWHFIHDYLAQLSTNCILDNNDGVPTNFNIPYIGKLYADPKKYKTQTLIK